MMWLAYASAWIATAAAGIAGIYLTGGCVVPMGVVYTGHDKGNA